MEGVHKELCSDPNRGSAARTLNEILSCESDKGKGYVALGRSRGRDLLVG
jgi:hypothetical protein